jgi:hypothetical protein
MNKTLRLSLLAAALLTAGAAQAQTGSVGIGVAVPNASAVLEVAANPASPKGLLLPRMTQAQRNLISSPAEGLLIYQTDGTPGLYQRTSNAWASVAISPLSTESVTTTAVPTTATSLAPATTTVVYTDNSNAAANGVITLTGGIEGQRLVIVNNDAQYLQIVSGSGTGNVLSKYGARYVYTAGAWRRES